MRMVKRQGVRLRKYFMVTSLAVGLMGVGACTTTGTIITDPDQGLPVDAASELDAFLEDLSPADLSDVDQIESTAWVTSAPMAYAMGILPVAYAEIQAPSGCPFESVEDGVVTWSGGCMDTELNEWFGTATQTGDHTSYDHFGYMPEDKCQVSSGMVNHGDIIAVEDGGDRTFQIEVMVEHATFDADCGERRTVVAYDYRGTSLESGLDSTIWNGEGTLGTETWGVLEAETVGEILDDQVCPTEAEAGKTSLMAGGDLVEIYYDGATDCDEEGTTPWTFNGDYQGELTGMGCSSLPLGPTLGGLSWLCMLLAVRRRRLESLR